MHGAVLHWPGRGWREQEEKRGGAERERNELEMIW
jgi:hypothetical protein